MIKTHWIANKNCQGLWSAKLTCAKTAYATWVRPDREYVIRIGAEYIGRFSKLPEDIETFSQELNQWRAAQGTKNAMFAVNPFSRLAI
jgi:hypothetical protein